MLHTLVKHSGNLTYNRVSYLYKVRLCFPGNINDQRLKFSTIHNLINLKQETLEKMELDPRVEKWKEKLLHSDYILSKSIKFGYRLNKRIESEMKRKEKLLKTQNLMRLPAISIALKYLNDQNLPGEKNENYSTEVEESEKPIYMPYAAKDSFEKVELPKSVDKIEEDESVLNNKFKALYEKYLEDLKSLENESEKSKEKLRLRLGDDLSKVPLTWMTDYETYNDRFEEEPWKALYGTPDPNSEVSSVPCGGCGALLHCKDSEIPGYLPSELFSNQRDHVLKSLICQRCHFMKFYNTSLDVKVSPEEYPDLLSVIKRKRCAVILMVDLTDFPCSIWPNISSLVGPRTPIFLVGNKIDLLPQDSPTFFQHISENLLNAVLENGISRKCVKHIALISAKSGFGIEELINKLQNIWGYKGDIYLVGCTNVGKSSLFNTLIQSDFCKVQAIDLMQRATTSPWPGTTLNLLKFPLTKPSSWRLYERVVRLKNEVRAKHLQEKLRKCQYNLSRNILFATLQGRIGRTFKLSRKQRMEENLSRSSHKYTTLKQFGINEELEAFKNCRWCFDTPGTVQPDQILDFLTTDELMKTLPKEIISPRTFILREGQTLFLAGMGRVDFFKVQSYLRCTVFASGELPVTICETIYADDIYRELLHTEAFVVPLNNSERLKLWPELRSKEMKVIGISEEESVADVVLSSAGWVALTPLENEEVTLKAWTPEGRGLYLRNPALLSKSVNFRGTRVRNCPAYKKGKQVYISNVNL